MNEFDIKAEGWDKSNMHRERAAAIAAEIISQIPLKREMNALEFGAGTGLLSFMLKDNLKEITLIDNSEGMVKVLNEKLIAAKADNLKVVKADLEHEDLALGSFDLIYTLMVLHHVGDLETIISKFHDLLNPGAFLAIADLYTEDGSFHGEGFGGHRGFDPGTLSALLQRHGFTGINYRKVYVIDKEVSEDSRKKFDVFLLTAIRS
ncbi:MAG: class I SAM-dependent methyltransferase [Bacteroidales bacterium]|nr:class I SAM-dependent methyltransferase [Bacteroidales bacterium]